MSGKSRVECFVRRAFIGAMLGILAMPACSNSGSSSSGSGGSGGSGQGGSGGTSATSGTSSASGGSGGNTNSGGTTSAGGVTGSGGTTSSGGITSAGGTTNAGGSGGASSGGAAGSGAGGASTKSDAGPDSASGGSGGGTSAGGATGSGGASGNGGGSGTGGATGSGGTTGSGGAASGGTGGTTDAGVDGPLSAKTFTCNTVLGIDSTSEWYTGGFENQVTDSKWQLIYNHPGYVEDWENPADAVYSKAPTSPCTANSDNPDRVILNVFADTSGSLTTSAAMVTGLSKAVDTIKSKYSRLKRLDLLTMSRGPNNQQCFSSANTVVASYVDDAIAKVVTAYPGLVTASPKFFVTNCSDFDSTNPPHLSTAGKTNMAKVYGDYYSTEP
jgi:hypothetical protein